MNNKHLPITLAVIVVFAIKCTKDAPTQSVSTDTTPPGAIANLSVTGIVDTTSVLVWTAPGDDGFVGKAHKYDLRYATDSTRLKEWTNAYKAPALPSPTEGGSIQQYKLAGLFLDSTYFFGMRTSDEQGNESQPSNTARESQYAFPKVYLTLPASGDSVSDYVLMRAIATDDKGISKIEFFVDNKSIGSDFVPPYETYWKAGDSIGERSLFVRATDTDNRVVGSKVSYCFVDKNRLAPSASHIQSFSEQTTSSMRIFWSANRTDLDFRSYVLLIGTIPQALVPVHTSYSANDTSIVVSQLLDSQQYFVSVRTEDSFSHASYGDTSSFITNNVVPRDVDIFLSSGDIYGTIRMQWKELPPMHDFRSYRIMRSLVPDVVANGTLAGEISNYYQTYTVYTAPLNDQQYYYGVVVYDRNGAHSIPTEKKFGWKDLSTTPRGSSLRFNRGDFCSAKTTDEINQLTEFTIEAWVKRETISINSVLGIHTDSTPRVSLFTFRHDGDNYLATVCRANGSGTYWGPRHFVIPNIWNHFAIVVSSDSLHVYVNGNIAQSEKLEASVCLEQSSDLFFGTLPITVNGARVFEGQLDEVRIWNHERSQSQIWNNFDHTIDPTISGLVGYWRLDDSTGNIATGLFGPDLQLGESAVADTSDPVWLRPGAPIKY